MYCYGRVDQWYLVEYEVNKGGHRRGFIHVPDGVGIAAKDLPEAGVNVVFKARTSLTDDPHYSRREVVSVPKRKVAKLLFFDGDFAYVKLKLENGLYQGFVPVSQLELEQ